MANLEAKITISAVDKVSAVSKQISKSLEGVKSATSNMSASWRNVGAAASNVVGQIRMLALASVGAGVAVFGVVKHYADMSEELSLASQRSGVATQSLQKLQYVAQKSNIPIDSLNTSLKFLNRSIGAAAADPTSKFSAAFTSMGINVHDATGKLKSADAILLEISDKFKVSTNVAAKTQIMMALAGRQGTSLIPVMNEGSVAIKNQMDQFSKLGHVLTDVENHAAKEFSESMKDLYTAVGGLGNVLMIDLIPVLEPIIFNMTQWVVLNKEWLAIEIKKDILLFADALKMAWQFLIRIKDSVLPIIIAFGGLKTVIGLVAGIYIARLGLSVMNLIGALGGWAVAIGKVTLAMLASPFTWFIAGVSLITFAGYELMAHWEKVKAFFSTLWASIRPHFAGFANFVDSMTNHVVSFFKAAWSTISPFLKKLWTGSSVVVGSSLDWILRKFGTNLNEVSKIFSDIFAAMKVTFTQFIDFLRKPFDWLVKTLGGVLETIKKVKDAIMGTTTTPIASPTPQAKAAAPFLAKVSAAGGELKPLVENNLGMMRPQATAGSQAAMQAAGSAPARIDIHMEIDYEGRPTKVTAKSPNEPIIFSANAGKMV